MQHAVEWTQLNARVTPDVKKWVAEQAKKERRSVNAFIQFHFENLRKQEETSHANHA